MKFPHILKTAILVNGLLLAVFAYKVAFSFWMNAHPLEQRDWWRRRFFLNLGFFSLVALLETILIAKWLRHRKGTASLPPA